MKNKIIQIISFDNPYPPNYGGVIDVFYKIKALHALGAEIHLHCFVFKIPDNYEELKSITKEVYFYKSSKNPLLFLSKIPFSIISRNNKDLENNLTKIVAPIIFEGLKTTYLVHKNKLQNHFKILRLHNIEQNYFSGISKSETSIIRKLAYKFESWKYYSYEKNIKRFDKVVSLSHFENDYVNKKYKNSIYIPVFHGNNFASELSTFGKYAFYHGDLRMSDNKRAVVFLIKLFLKIPDYYFIIASNNASNFVKGNIGLAKNISYIEIKNQEHLDQLFENAHINVMLSFQESGTKLKLINSLFKSRFCIINSNIVDDEYCKKLCEIAETEKEFIEAIDNLKKQKYLDYEQRKIILNQIFNDAENAKLIYNLIN